MRRFLFLLTGLGLTFFAITTASWLQAPSSDAVAIDPDALAAARDAGETAGRLRLDGEDRSPSSLEEVRAIWNRAELKAVRERLEGYLAEVEPRQPAVLHAMLSVVCRRQRDGEAAVRHGRSAAELMPTNAEVHHVYARAIVERMRGGGMMAALRNASTWRAELRTTIELDPSNTDARLEELLFYAFVPPAMGGDRDRARVLLAELSELDPGRASAMEARMLQNDGDLEGAREVIDRRLSGEPGDAEVLLALADLLEEEQDFELADEAIQAAMNARPAEAGWRATYKRARSQLDEEREGDPVLTLSLLDEYAEGAPRSDYMPTPAQALLTRARALSRLGRMDEAEAAYRSALDADEEVDESGEVADELREAGVNLGQS